ncbi:hypothetical protein GNI_224630, partial [Gregarina niphandrodes]
MATATGRVAADVGFIEESRFVNTRVIAKQSAKDDWIAKVTAKPLPPMRVDNEEHFEDWVDEVVGLESMIEVLLTQIPPAKRQRLARVDRGLGIPVEQFISDVARLLFPTSTYAMEAYVAALTVLPNDFVQLSDVLLARIARYVRLARRWGLTETITRAGLDMRVRRAASPQWRTWYTNMSVRGKSLLDVVDTVCINLEAQTRVLAVVNPAVNVQQSPVEQPSEMVEKEQLGEVQVGSPVCATCG